MSTIRATYVQHGSSAVPNITLNASGQVIVASGIVSSGTFAAPTGSAAAPGVYFVGDTNTGLYSPGADQVAVATNGTGRLFVDASGNVGVGGSATDVLSITRSANSAGGISIVNTNNAQASAISQLYIQGGNNAHAQLKFSVNSLDTSIRGQGDGSLAIIQGVNERMRLDSAGLVGIGTSSPSGNLHVYNPATTSADIYLENTDGYYNFKLNNQNLDIFEGATSRLRIASGGNVGIGTSSPNELLHVVNSGSNGGTIQIGSQAVDGGNSRLNLWGVESYVAFRHRNVGSGNDLAYVVGGPANFGTDNSSYLAFGTRTAANVLGERVRITSAGRVGIGTTSPASSLHILPSGDGYFTSGLRVARSTVTPTQYGLFNYSNGSLNIIATDTALGNPIITFGGSTDGSNRSERARIDSSGRLLVGTSTAPSSGLIQASDAAGAELTLARNDASVVAGNQLGRISWFGNDGGTYEECGRITCEADLDHAAGDKPSRLVFATTADGASSPTERMRISSAGTVTLGGDDPSLANSSARFFQIAGSSSASGSVFESKATSTSTRYHFLFTYSTSSIGSITTTSSSTAYNTSSDYRLKENVSAVTDGITRLLQLKPSRFNFIAAPGHTVDGFIAHEAQAVVPECVTGAKDAVDADGQPLYQGIDQSKLVPLLTAALQEAIGRIESLEARLTAASL